MVEIRDVIQRQISLSWLSSSTTARTISPWHLFLAGREWIWRYQGPKKNSYEDRNGRSGIKSSGILYACTNDFGESVEEMNERGGKLVATDKSATVTETLLDAIIVEDCQGGTRLADSAGTYEGHRSAKVFDQTDDLFD